MPAAVRGTVARAAPLWRKVTVPVGIWVAEVMMAVRSVVPWRGIWVEERVRAALVGMGMMAKVVEAEEESEGESSTLPE